MIEHAVRLHRGTAKVLTCLRSLLQAQFGICQDEFEAQGKNWNVT